MDILNTKMLMFWAFVVFLGSLGFLLVGTSSYQSNIF